MNSTTKRKVIANPGMHQTCVLTNKYNQRIEKIQHLQTEKSLHGDHMKMEQYGTTKTTDLSMS